MGSSLSVICVIMLNNHAGTSCADGYWQNLFPLPILPLKPGPLPQPPSIPFGVYHARDVSEIDLSLLRCHAPSPPEESAPPFSWIFPCSAFLTRFPGFSVYPAAAPSGEGASCSRCFCMPDRCSHSLFRNSARDAALEEGIFQPASQEMRAGSLPLIQNC